MENYYEESCTQMSPNHLPESIKTAETLPMAQGTVSRGTYISTSNPSQPPTTTHSQSHILHHNQPYPNPNSLQPSSIPHHPSTTPIPAQTTPYTQLPTPHSTLHPPIPPPPSNKPPPTKQPNLPPTPTALLTTKHITQQQERSSPKFASSALD